MEHRVFCGIFDQMERITPGLQTLAEVQLLGRLIEGMLQDHSDTEDNLAFLALDHVLEERGQLDRLYQDHQEIDGNLRQVQTAGDVAEAQRLLKKAITASRKHFAREEDHVFPLLNAALKAETLGQLAEAWKERSSAAAGA